MAVSAESLISTNSLPNLGTAGSGDTTAAPRVWYPDYELPDYEVDAGEATSYPGSGKRQNGYGLTYIDKWDMNDEAGTSYQVMRCLADEPRSNVWIVKDTAWSTQVTGLNTDVARKMMKMGFNVLVKGPEINSSIPLSQTAFNMHKILDTMHEKGDLDARQIAVEGYSRGSMVGFGTNAYAPQFNRQVLYSNLTDPCIGRPINVKHKVIPSDMETVKKAVTLPADIAMLGIAVAKGLMQPSGRRLAKSVDFSPKGAAQFYRTGKPLMTGEAGMLATQVPDDMQATIAFFRRCHVNDADAFEEILGTRRPGVRFVRPEGGHGGGIDSRIIGNVAVRFGRLADQLSEGRTPSDIDYRYITFGIKSVG